MDDTSFDFFRMLTSEFYLSDTCSFDCSLCPVLSLELEVGFLKCLEMYNWFVA
jgi:hypothetical protein